MSRSLYMSKAGFSALGLALIFFATQLQAGVIVTFKANINGATPGPFTAGTAITGNFTIDDTVNPTTGGIKYFNGALDNVILSIAGQSFGGTNGRYFQYTGGNNGVNGFMGGTLGGTYGSTFGTWTTGSSVWNFNRMTLDLRGLTAILFPSSNPKFIGSGFGRTNDGNNSNDQITTALMNLRFTNQLSGSVFSEALNIQIGSIRYSRPSDPVPEPATLFLLIPALLVFRRSRKYAN